MRISDWSSDVCSSDLKRARRGLSDRIFVDELRALLARRICERAADVHAQRGAFLGRMAAADRLGAALCRPRHYLAVREDPILLLRLRVGEGHRPALPLRPAHEAGLEGFSADLADLGVPGVRLSDADEVFMSNIAHLVRTFTLWEFVQAHWLTLKYFFKPKATINYPFEKNNLSPPFRVKTHRRAPPHDQEGPMR